MELTRESQYSNLLYEYFSHSILFLLCFRESHCWEVELQLLLLCLQVTNGIKGNLFLSRSRMLFVQSRVEDSGERNKDFSCFPYVGETEKKKFNLCKYCEIREKNFSFTTRAFNIIFKRRTRGAGGGGGEERKEYYKLQKLQSCMLLLLELQSLLTH